MKNQNKIALKKLIKIEPLKKWPVIQMFNDIFKSILGDIKILLFNQEGRDSIFRSAQHLHFIYSLPIGALVYILVLLTGFSPNPDMWLTLPIAVISAFAAFAVNGVREMTQAFFEWRDVRFGTYGGFIAGIICWLITLLF